MIGSKLAHYEVKSHLGSGGMGEVYQATDLKLGRSVAIKLLPEAFALDAERAARFEREARMLASLNHPHIAAIYGIEESGDRKFLVMELVPGETLADRIKRGPIPVNDALEIAQQICEALEAAHETGIVHRDLKPANIKLTDDGNVKVLDFGLAKAYGGNPAPSGEGYSNSPTMMSASVPGVIMGTAAYMSPEQARGKQIDRRTDVWAFGCVLFEMLVGQAAFQGEDFVQILGAVVRGEPDWKALPPEVSAPVRTVLQRCLQKDPKKRLHDIRDAWIEIEDLTTAQTSIPIQSASSHTGSQRLWQIATGIFGIACAALGIAYFTNISEPVLPIHVSIPDQTGDAIAISPDGQYIALVTKGTTAPVVLKIRSLHSPAFQEVAGSDGAAAPFWSPDSHWIGFFSQGKLKKVDVNAGKPQVICDVGTTASSRASGTWNQEGTILFGIDVRRPLYRVSASGGQPVAVTTVDESQSNGHFRPVFLPDGHQFLFLKSDATSAAIGSIYSGSLDSAETKLVLPDLFSTVQYLPPRYLLHVRGGALFAQELDVSSLKIAGDPVQITDSVFYEPSTGGGATFSASDNGTLIYRPQSVSPPRQIKWFDRIGREITTLGQPDFYANPRLSPDGHRLAVDKLGSPYSIWLSEASNGTPTRFTFDAGGRFPVWSADGMRVLFKESVFSDRVYQKLASGEGATEPAVDNAPEQLDDISPDGRYLVFSTRNAKTNRDIVLLPFDGSHTAVPFATSVANETQAQISSDGKWIAYIADDSGRSEVYVQSFPNAGGKRQVSIEGGVQPIWRPDGKELFFLGLDGKLMAVTVSGSSGAGLSAPKALFETHVWSLESGIGTRAQYDVTSDGQRFVINTATQAAENGPINVIFNWPELLKR